MLKFKFGLSRRNYCQPGEHFVIEMNEQRQETLLQLLSPRFIGVSLNGRMGEHGYKKLIGILQPTDGKLFYLGFLL